MSWLTAGTRSCCEANRRPLLAALTQDPGLLQRFALRAAGCGRRLAVAVRRSAAVLAAYEPSTI